MKKRLLTEDRKEKRNTMIGRNEVVKRDDTFTRAVGPGGGATAGTSP